MSQVERIARIHLTLQSGRGLSRRQMEAMFEVSAATVIRDIEYMRDRLEAPIVYDAGRGAYIYDQGTDIPSFERRYQMPGMWLTADETYGVLTLFNLLKDIDPGFLSAFVEPIRPIMKKLLIAQGHVMQGFDKKIEVDLPRFINASQAIARKAFQATLKEVPITIVTKCAGHCTPIDVQPLKLLLRETGWTLRAHNLDSEQAEDIPISDIESVVDANGPEAHQERGTPQAPELKSATADADAAHMDFETPSEYGRYGFEGGCSVRELRSAIDRVPPTGGVYLVVRSPQRQYSVTEESTGYWWKGKNPAADVHTLRERLCTQPESPIMYIGKAGGAVQTLRGRIRQYLRFGAGQRSPHWGGRYIWQLAEAESLLVYWRPEPNDEPREVERRLIALHEARYGSLPFANLRR